MAHSLTFHDLNADHTKKVMALVAKLQAHDGGDETADDDDADEIEDTKPAKQGRKAKPVEEDDDDDGSIEDDDGEDAEADDSFDEEIEEDEVTLAQVMKAFKPWSKLPKAKQAPAFKVLAKFKAKSPQGLKEKNYPAVLKAMKALKVPKA